MKSVELRGHEKAVNFVKFNLDGDLFFTGAAEKRVNVWRNHTLDLTKRSPLSRLWMSPMIANIL